MRKMYAGLIILAVLLCAAIYNVHYLDKKTNQLLAYVDTAGELAERGDFDSARTLLRQAINYWDAMELYTDVFIRHSEIDSTLDAFYDCLGCMHSGSGEYSASLEKLRAHLSGMLDMERLSLGSIF